MRLALGLLSLTTLAACGSTPDRTVAYDTRADRVAAALIGTFSSEAQSLADESYFHVRLVHTPIWPGLVGEHWLYVEQAVASALDRPYRQRVYHVYSDGDGVRSDVYLLPGDVSQYAGGWDRPEMFESIGPENLEPRTGCAIHLTASATGFSGSTHDRDCGSTRDGAAYATSIVELSQGRITSWDRGFDADGDQVWGAVDGPYVFERTTKAP